MTHCDNDNLVRWKGKWEQESPQIQPSTVSNLFLEPRERTLDRHGGTEQSQGNVCGEGDVSPGRAVGLVGSWEAKEPGGRGTGEAEGQECKGAGCLRGRVSEGTGMPEEQERLRSRRG